MDTGRVITKAHPRRLAAAAGVALLALTSCGQSPDAGTETTESTTTPTSTVVIGLGPTRQGQPVAHAWGLALEDAGFAVEFKEIDGGRDAYVKAIENGELDLFPDYTGDLYLNLKGAEPSPAASSTPTPAGSVTDSDVEKIINSRLPETVRLLDAASAHNKRSMVITAATQAHLSAESLGDLAEHCQELRFGVVDAQPQNTVMQTALKDVYGCQPKDIKGYESEEQVFQALVRGEIDVAGVLSSSPTIGDNSLKILEDPDDALVPERVVAVAHQKLPERAVDEVNAISEELDTDDLVLLTRMITSSPQRSPEEAAEYWYGRVGQ